MEMQHLPKDLGSQVISHHLERAQSVIAELNPLLEAAAATSSARGQDYQTKLQQLASSYQELEQLLSNSVNDLSQND